LVELFEGEDNAGADGVEGAVAAVVKLLIVDQSVVPEEVMAFTRQ
jgi:hypothetical protein